MKGMKAFEMNTLEYEKEKKSHRDSDIKKVSFPGSPVNQMTENSINMTIEDPHNTSMKTLI